MNSFWNIAAILIGYAGIFGSAELMYHKLHIEGEYTRKFIHIFAGLLGLSLPFFIDNDWLVGSIGAFFIVLLFLSIRFHFFRSVNDVDRITLGNMVYPLGIMATYFAFRITGQYIYTCLPLLIVSFCDPAAALAGRKWHYKIYRQGMEKKSVSGSLAFFLLAVIISIVVLYFLSLWPWSKLLAGAVLISIVATAAEALSWRGSDNLSIPLFAIAALWVAERFL